MSYLICNSRHRNLYPVLPKPRVDLFKSFVALKRESLADNNTGEWGQGVGGMGHQAVVAALLIYRFMSQVAPAAASKNKEWLGNAKNSSEFEDATTNVHKGSYNLTTCQK
ncbi:hypothetical protein NL676_000296 [Syzygium grande]|nr:hypothetical protein NL676_000296 [Syzygium grande]